MAYLTVFYTIDLELLEGGLTYPELKSAATRVGHCSHYLAVDPRFAKLLDTGHPIPGATHPFVVPHYLLPHELPAVQRTLEELLEEVGLVEVGDGGWVTEQLSGFLNACAVCIQSQQAMLVLLA